MVTKEEVLKAIVECADKSGNADYYTVADKLSIDMQTLNKIILDLKPSHIANFELASIKVTDITIRIYNDLIRKLPSGHSSISPNSSSNAKSIEN